MSATSPLSSGPTAQASPGKSTNVRASSTARPGLLERALRAGFRTLGPFAPGPAAVLADTLFFSAPRGRSARIDAILQTGRRRDLGRGAGRVATWTWGAGPRVVLLHGWGGRAGQLAAFVDPLVAAGYEVVALDAPGHGHSPGLRSSMVGFAAALRAVDEAMGPIHAVIAHSLGGAAATLALAQGLRVPRVVLIGAPAGPTEWTRLFAERLAVPALVMERMRARAEKRLGYTFRQLDVPLLAAEITTPALIIHDRDDREVSWEEGAAVAAAWPESRLMTTTGLGHRRVLREPGVIAEAVAFVQAGRSTDAGRPGTPACVHRLRRCEACRLEEDLFVRSRRWLGAAAAL